MNKEPSDTSRKVSRRAIITISTAAAGTVAAGVVLGQNSDSSDATTSTPSPEPSTKAKLTDRDGRVISRLEKTQPTSGVRREYRGAFPALKIKSVEPLPGLGSGPWPWLAVSIAGTARQLQIVDTSVREVIHTLDFPESHTGGLETMKWDTRNKKLYIGTANALHVWIPSKPKITTFVGKVDAATTIYDLQLDSRGVVWGGSYPAGSVFNFDPQNHKITVSSRFAEDTDYVRRLAIGSTDRLWVGTGSVHPRIFTFTASKPDARTEIGLPEDVPEGFISRIEVRNEKVLVSASSISGQLVLNPMTKQWEDKIERVWAARVSSDTTDTTKGFYTITDNTLYFTRIATLQDTELADVKTSKPLSILQQQNQVAIIGQSAAGLTIEHFDSHPGTKPNEHVVELNAGQFAIQSLMGHSDGNIYMGGYMGSGLASINIESGQTWSSPPDENLINQAEAMIQFNDRRSYVGSYGSADLISFNTLDKNSADEYHLLARLATDFHQSRPFGWAKNSNRVFFGTVPDYGRSGGVLGEIDPEKNKVTWVLDGGGKGFIAGHSIIGLVADEDHVYGTTSVRNGYGLPDTEGSAYVFKFDIGTREIIWTSKPLASAGALYAPVLVANWLVVADVEGLGVIDPRSGKLVKHHLLSGTKNQEVRPGWANADIAKIGEGVRLVHTAAGTATAVDFENGTRARVGQSTKLRLGSRLTTTPDGRVFGTIDKTTLVELELGTPSSKPQM